MTQYQDLQYTLSPARYAKGKLALSIPGIGGWKSTAACILIAEIAPNVRYSHREHAYIVSSAQAIRFEQAIQDVIKRRQEIAAAAMAGTDADSIALHVACKASSTIARIGYDYERTVLAVEFKSGARYCYFDVPVDVYRGIVHSNSLGSALHKLVKVPGYKYERVA